MSDQGGGAAVRTQLWRDRRLLLLLVVAAGLAARLFRLDAQSLWYDEAWSVHFSALPFDELRRRLVSDLPLHYGLLQGWFALFGFGAWQARALSAVAGTVAILMAFLVGRRLFDERTGLLSALLLALSQTAVHYSQEARPYALEHLFALCAAWSFLAALEGRRRLHWAAFLLFSALLVYSHWFGLLVLAALLLWLLAHRRAYGVSLRAVFALALFPLLALAPWVTVLALHAEESVRSEVIPSWQPAWFQASVWSYWEALKRFNDGQVAGIGRDVPRWAWATGLVLFTAPVVVALAPLLLRAGSPEAVRRRRHLQLALLLAALPPLVVVAGSAVLGSQYAYRYVAVSAAFYYVLAAAGLLRLRPPALRAAAIVAAVAFSAFALRSVWFSDYRENWRDALDHVAANLREGDVCVFLPYAGVPMQWHVYHRGRPEPPTAAYEDVLAGSVPYERVWCLCYTRAWDIGREALAKERRLAATHERVERKRYHWVQVTLLVPDDR